MPLLGWWRRGPLGRRRADIGKIRAEGQGTVLAGAPNLDGKMRFGAIIGGVGCEYSLGRCVVVVALA